MPLGFLFLIFRILAQEHQAGFRTSTQNANVVYPQAFVLFRDRSRPSLHHAIRADRAAVDGLLEISIVTGLILSAFAAVVIISAVSTASQNLSGSTAQAPAQTAPAKTQPDPQQAANSAPAAPKESKWVSYYGDYYVTCYVTDGIRWYSAINQNNVNDAQVNQTPSDDEWAQMCSRD